MKKNKICFIIPNYDPKTATHYLHVYELIEKLAVKHRVFLFAESGKNYVVLKNIEGYYVQKIEFLPLRMLERIAWFIRLRWNGYKLFYNHYTFTSAIYSSITTFFLGGKTFLWMCVEEHRYKKTLSLHSIKTKLNKEWPIIISMRSVHKLVTCSEKMKKYYQKYFNIQKDKIIILTNWVNVKRFSELSSTKREEQKKLGLEGKNVILFLHQLSRRKGADRLPHIILKVVKKSNTIHFLIAGKGPLSKKLESNIKARKLLKHVTFLGDIPNASVPSYLKATDVLLVPSRIEEFGRVYLEAMASGVPIVATQTKGTRTILNKVQKKWEVDQKEENKVVKELSRKIIHLIQNKKERLFLSKIGKKRVKKFSLDIATQQFEKNILGDK